MKKIFLSILALASLALAGKQLYAINLEGNPPPFVSTKGSGMDSGAALIWGKTPGDSGCTGTICSAGCDITAGDVVILAGTAFPMEVSKTATAGVETTYGIALTTATYGNPVQVCSSGGGRVRVNTACTSVVGAYYISSSTTGKVTATAAVATLGSYSGTSKTAIIIRALESKTWASGDQFFMGEILK